MDLLIHGRNFTTVSRHSHECTLLLLLYHSSIRLQIGEWQHVQRLMDPSVRSLLLYFLCFTKGQQPVMEFFYLSQLLCLVFVSAFIRHM